MNIIVNVVRHRSAKCVVLIALYDAKEGIYYDFDRKKRMGKVCKI